MVDTDLERQVAGFLRSLDQSAARSVDVRAGAQGVLILQGQVKSYYTRQVVVQCCRRIPGITAVVDELRVAP